jgi:hypothetical protein
VDVVQTHPQLGLEIGHGVSFGKAQIVEEELVTARLRRGLVEEKQARLKRLGIKTLGRRVIHSVDIVNTILRQRDSLRIVREGGHATVTTVAVEAKGTSDPDCNSL